MKATVKRIKDKSPEVDCTLKREQIWEIQTPQVFKKDLIMKAYTNIGSEDMDMPDDAFLVERLGHRIALVLGSSLNIKVTTPDDLVLATAISKVTHE
jgi:2-C-methyl-D-erythritol 4-phosphate cytidylyltransferase